MRHSCVLASILGTSEVGEGALGHNPRGLSFKGGQRATHRKIQREPEQRSVPAVYRTQGSGEEPQQKYGIVESRLGASEGWSRMALANGPAPQEV